MEQLLKITTTNVKYQLKVENAKLEYNQDFIPKSNMKTTPGKFTIQTEPAQLNLDTYQARKSLGFLNSTDLVARAAEKGKQGVTDFISNTISVGQSLGKIEDGNTIGSIMRQKLLEYPDYATVFLPSTGADISWQPHSIQMQYQQAELNTDWDVNSRVKFDYVPGDVSMEIIEHPSVDIEYIGTPIYFPRSADPNYEPPIVV